VSEQYDAVHLLKMFSDRRKSFNKVI